MQDYFPFIHIFAAKVLANGVGFGLVMCTSARTRPKLVVLQLFVTIAFSHRQRAFHLFVFFTRKNHFTALKHSTFTKLP